MISSHTHIFDKLTQAVKSVQKAPPRKQVQHLSKVLVPAIAEKASQARGPIKKFYERAHNSCSSMADGIKSGDATSQDFLSFVQEMAEYTSSVRAIESAPPKEAKQLEEAGGVYKTDSEEWLINQAKHAEAVLRKYRIIESTVPRSIPKKFLATRLPVLALTHPGLSREKLDAFKMLGDTFFGYPILKNQVLLGLNSDWVLSEYKRDLDEAVDDILVILKATTGKTLYRMGDSRKRGLVDWVWLVTDNDMRRMNQASLSGHFVLKAWSFPFEANETIKALPPKAPQ